MRTQQTLDAIKLQLHQNCGDMLHACQTVGVSLVFVQQWRKDDQEVDKQLLEAEQLGTQGLISAAIQRGVRGIDEDIYYRGEVVGSRKMYSDGLLQSLLKAKVPEFSKDGDGGARVSINIANIMPRASNYEEWLAMKQATLEAPREALPAPDEPIDAEFEAVADPTPVHAGVEKPRNPNLPDIL